MEWNLIDWDPAVHLLLRVSPVSSLALPSFVASLVSVCQPPSGCPSSSWPSSLVPAHLSPFDVSTVWGCTFREGGRYVRIVDCFVCFVPHVSPSPWLLIWCQECLVVFPNYPVFKSSSLSVSVCQVYFVMCVSPAGSCMYHPGFDYIKSCWTLFLASSLLPAQSVTQGVHRVDNICNNQLNLIGVSHFVPQTH